MGRPACSAVRISRGDIEQPRGAAAALGTGLGQQDRPVVARVHAGQEIGQGLVLVVAERDGPAALLPLVLAVVVDADDVEIVGPAAEPGLETAAEHVPGRELDLAKLAAHDVDQGIDLDEAGARVDLAHGLDAGDRGTNQLALDVVAAAGRQRVELHHVAGPGPERDLVDRAVEGDTVGLVADDACGSTGEVAEAVDELAAPRK